MLLIISPAKNLIKKSIIYENVSEIIFPKEAEILAGALKKMKPVEISRLMQISPKLAEVNYERYQKWHYPFTGKEAGTALYMFQGDVYKGMQAESFNDDDMNFAQNHLRILSGLYGILKPWDIILPYRLEAGSDLKIGKAQNLYDFWGKKIHAEIQKNLIDQNTNILINLASAEYYQLARAKDLKANMITPVFKEYKNGEYKQIAISAKKARGMMCRYVIKNKLVNPEDLKGFDFEDYSFNEPLSTNKEFVFTR